MEAMCQAGNKVLAVDFSDDGAEVADKAGAAFFKADLTDGEQCRAAVEEAVSRFGRLDILVNNAGIQHVERIKEFPQAKWDQIIALMLTAPFTLIQAAWPHMEKNGYGRIVNMASIHAHVASPGKAAYVSAKHGLMGLTRTAALEGGESGIINARPLGFADEGLLTTLAGHNQCLLLVLDQITDAHNFGACLRTAVAMGVDAVVCPKHHAASLTPTVAEFFGWCSRDDADY